MDNNYVMHFGIKGMRWGVRRYQNKDGSLTPAGKKRYKSEEERTEAIKEARSTNRNKNPQGYWATQHAKRAILASAASMATAGIGSAAVNAAAKRGKTAAAESIYFLSTQTVRGLKAVARFETFAAGINAALSGKQIPNYLREERRIKREM